MKRLFDDSKLSDEIYNLQKNLEDSSKSLIIIIDNADYKIVRSNTRSTDLLKELVDCETIDAKDDFIVNKHNENVWLSKYVDQELFIKNDQLEENLNYFLEENNLTKKDLISFLKNS